MAKFKKPYEPRERVSKTFNEPSLAKQAFKDECDINNIMRKYEKQGLLEHVNTHRGQYGDLIGYEDYHASMNAILAAQDAFMSVPARIRARFDNDPAEFVRFVQDPANLPELQELGLARSAAPEATPPAPAPEPAPPPQDGS